MYVNGSAKAGAARLKAQDLSPFDQRDFPSGRTADKTMSFTINQTDATTWVLDHDAFKEPDVPILKGAASPAWNASTTIQLPLNSTVDVIFNIANQSMDVVSFYCWQQSVRRRARLTVRGTFCRWAIRSICTVTSSGSWDPARARFLTMQSGTRQKGC